MRIFKKIIPVAILALTSIAISACGGGAHVSTSESGGESSSTQTVKRDPVINIALEDGKQFNVGAFVEPQITVTPASLTETVSYVKGNQTFAAAPTEVGDYRIVVRTEETDEYNAGEASKSFLIRNVPTLSFFYGDGNALEEGHVFYEGNVPSLYATASVNGASITYAYADAQERPLQAAPTTAGTYYLTASVARTETIGSTSATISYRIDAKQKENTTITFKLNGTDVDTSETHWLAGGYVASQYFVDEDPFANITYVINQTSLQSSLVVEYAFKPATDTSDADASPVEAFPTPREAGVYVITVSFPGNDDYNRSSNYIMYGLKARPTKDVPTVGFKLNGVAVDTSETHWLAGGYVASQYFIDEDPFNNIACFIEPESLQSSLVISYAFKPATDTSDADASPVEAFPSPRQAGTYVINISFAGNNDYEAATNYIMYGLKERPSKQVPTITFKLAGTAIDIAGNGNHWVAGGYAASLYYPDTLPELTYEVNPNTLQVAVSYTLNEAPIASLPNPLTAGTYALTVTVTGNDEYEDASEYVLFAIQDRPAKQVPTITFKLNGVAIDIAGNENHWVAGGYAASVYYPDELPTITYEVPEGLTAVVSYTLNETPIASLPNPLTPGTYAMTVSVEGNDTYESGSEYVLFAIQARPEKQVPTITFKLNGVDVTHENHWLGEGYGDSRITLEQFATLTYEISIEGLTGVVSYTRNEVPYAGEIVVHEDVYCMTVTVAEGEENAEASNYILFRVVESL